MRTLLSVIIFAFSGSLLVAQHDFHCGQDQVMNAFYKKHPEKKLLRQVQDQAFRMNMHNHEVNAASYTIPIVFHILHLGGPENISDAQVIDGLRVLNRDFAKQNPDTTEIIPSFKQLADSMQIQFALPTIDPNGNCTNGIIHYYDPATDWTDFEFPNYTWDPTRYLNVYIVRSITLSSGFGAAGYTYFPGTWPDGDPNDAIFMLNNYFGTFGTGNAFTSRVLTHEVGHWLGLAHVFGGNPAAFDCNNDDFISDTPTTPGYVSCPDVNDPASYQICTPGVDENFQNYMDYSYCVRMFTQEQGAVMRSCLQSAVSGRDNLSSSSNLVSTGVISPQTCAPEADFTYDRHEVCVGVPVTFSDLSQNGTPTTYTWTLTGATPALSNAASPTVTYSTPGVYSVTYTSANSAGTSAPVTKINIINVTSTTALHQNSFSEGFETDVFASGDWNEYGTNGGSHWVTTFDAAHTGLSSAKIPFSSNTRQVRTSMESPSIDLSSFTNPALSYRFAFQETNPLHVNNFRVFITADCGVSWTCIDSVGGMDLTTAGIGPAPYIPADQSEWMFRAVNLSAFASEPFVYFRFMYTRDTLSAANNFYVDDINISGSVGLAAKTTGTGISVFPNPTSGELTVRMEEAADEVFVTDVYGRTIARVLPAKMETEIRLFSQKLPSGGIYFVHARYGSTSIVKKIIVK